MTNIQRYETTGRPVLITAVRHYRIPYLKNLVGQVAPQVLPDLRKHPKIACIPFPRRNLDSFRQDLQDNFGLEYLYPVHPVDPVKNENSNAIKFFFRLN